MHGPLSRSRMGIIAAVVLLPLVVACTGTPATSSPAAAPATGTSSASNQQLTVRSMDTLKFDPTTLSAKAGQPIQLTLDNSGSQLVHDFTIADGVPQPIKITAQPGQRATGTFTIEKPGSYTYACSQPGHAEAGMKGTLTLR